MFLNQEKTQWVFTKKKIIGMKIKPQTWNEVLPFKFPKINSWVFMSLMGHCIRWPPRLDSQNLTTERKTCHVSAMFDGLRLLVTSLSLSDSCRHLCLLNQ